MSLTQATPALLSLKVHRTADEIISMNTKEAISITSQPSASALKAQHVDVEVDNNADELATLRDIFEQQCFSLVAFRNTIHDTRKRQNEMLQNFRTFSGQLEKRLNCLQHGLSKKVQEMNFRVDMISKTLAPKPIFRRIQPENAFGRITGIDIVDDHIALTTLSGYLVVLNRLSFTTETSNQPFAKESLYYPSFVKRDKSLYLCAVSSGRKLLLASPYNAKPVECLEDKVDCFAIARNSRRKETFDIVTGKSQGVSFYSGDLSKPNALKVIGETKNLKGTITQIVIDSELQAVYVLTSRKMFYSISSSTYQVLSAKQFGVPVMQLALTMLFIVITVAPNDVLFVERNREEFNEISKFEVTDGLRRLYATDKSIFVVTKNQEIERRTLAKPEVADKICEARAGDYDPKEFISTVLECGGEIFVAHGNRLSVWL